MTKHRHFRPAFGTILAALLAVCACTRSSEESAPPAPSAPTAPGAAPIVLDPDNAVVQEEVLDATRITRTMELERIGGRYAVPVSAWLNPDEIPLYDPATDSLEFLVRHRPASADETGNLIFHEEGPFNVSVTVKGPDGLDKIIHAVTGFRNHFDGERLARITYRVPGENGLEEVATVSRAYQRDGRSLILPLSLWLDKDLIDPEEELEWLHTDDFDAGAIRLLDTQRGSVDDAGTLTYRNDGRVRITLRKPSGTPFDSISIDIENSTEGTRSTTRAWHQPKPLDVSEHVLVVYNRSSSDSETLKDHYIRERPGFEPVNVLGVEAASDEVITEEEYLERIQAPVVNWLLDTGKNIRYIVLMLDIPTRVHSRVPADDGNSSRLRIGDSLSHRLAFAFENEGIRSGASYFDDSYHGPLITYLGTPFSLAQFEGMTALVTHLNMGDLEASMAYVDKIKSFDRTGAILHPAGDSYARNFYMEDHDAHNRLPSNFFSHRYLDRMAAGFERADEMNVIHRPKGSGHIVSGENVAFFGTLGRWGGRGANYAVDGQVQWGDNSDWWLMMSVESFNGQRAPSRRQGGEVHASYGPMDQGNYVDWFGSNAFGGTGYSRTPVGAVCHVEEPTTGGVNNWSYLAMWHDGFTFAECAWISRRTGRFMAIGDPLVARKPPE